MSDSKKSIEEFEKKLNFAWFKIKGKK